MTAPDHTLAARLAELQINATDEDLHEEGRYFDGCHSDLTQCTHGDTGNYSCRHDGPLIAALWNAYRTNQLITTAEADARVKAAVLAEREAAKSMVWTLGHEIKASMLVDEDNERAVLDMVKATAAAIRSRGVTG